MPNTEDDVERFKRIRDQQLKARDPQTRERKIQREISLRQRKSRQSFSFRKMLADVPRAWSGLILGVFLGLLASIIMPLFISASWVNLLGLAITFFLAILGLAVGHALDGKQELEDLIGK
ncbi:MAG: hypothetical protein IIC78_13065 [Chloroflexi bacterium]|nr:hypothetical protein [Chloroflexota bacterium]